MTQKNNIIDDIADWFKSVFDNNDQSQSLALLEKPELGKTQEDLSTDEPVKAGRFMDMISYIFKLFDFSGFWSMLSNMFRSNSESVNKETEAPLASDTLNAGNADTVYRVTGTIISPKFENNRNDSSSGLAL